MLLSTLAWGRTQLSSGCEHSMPQAHSELGLMVLSTMGSTWQRTTRRSSPA